MTGEVDDHNYRNFFYFVSNHPDKTNILINHYHNEIRVQSEVNTQNPIGYVMNDKYAIFWNQMTIWSVALD